VVIDLNMAGRDRVRTAGGGENIAKRRKNSSDYIWNGRWDHRIGFSHRCGEVVGQDESVGRTDSDDFGAGSGAATGLGREAKFWKRTGLTCGHNEGTNKFKRFPAAPAGAEGLAGDVGLLAGLGAG
jgi:hypothetical protein